MHAAAPCTANLCCQTQCHAHNVGRLADTYALGGPGADQDGSLYSSRVSGGRWRDEGQGPGGAWLRVRQPRALSRRRGQVQRGPHGWRAGPSAASCSLLVQPDQATAGCRGPVCWLLSLSCSLLALGAAEGLQRVCVVALQDDCIVGLRLHIMHHWVAAGSLRTWAPLVFAFQAAVLSQSMQLYTALVAV